MAFTDFSGYDLLNQHAELVPVLQCECVVSLSNELDATYCSHCTTDPNSSFWYNMCNRITWLKQTFLDLTC